MNVQKRIVCFWTLALLAATGLGIWTASVLRRPPASAFAPIAGTLRLTVDADPATFCWAVLTRDGASGDAEFRVERLRGGDSKSIEWREAQPHPRDWKLKFGPTRHPTYQLFLLPDAATPPVPTHADLPGFHDPARARAVAYFGIPLDGEKALTISLRPLAPFTARVRDPSGAPMDGVVVTGIATPRYVFEDGTDPERVDAMQVSWSWTFWNWDHVPKYPVAAERIVKVKTDASGEARFDGFVGWIGLSERDEKFAFPRSVLGMPGLRAQEFVAGRDFAQVRLTVDGLPGRDQNIGERGLVVEGDWPLPPGRARQRWSEMLPFAVGSAADVTTPCREIRIRPLSPVHRVAEGATVADLKPGETRRHKAVLVEEPHRLIEGEVVLEPRGPGGREYCAVELHEGGPAGRMLRAAGSLRGPGVPASGRVPFGFHVTEAGPYAIVVRTASYPWTVVHDVAAPREALEIRLAPDPKTIPVEVVARTRDGKAAPAVAGAWPHRELAGEFQSGTAAAGRPGRNTFVVHGDAGNATARDVFLEEGKPAPRIEVVLVEGATVTGKLVDVKGRPVPGQWVHLSWPGYFRMPNAFRFLADLTDADGLFEIRRVPPGPWRPYTRGAGIPLGDPFEIPDGASTFDAGPRSFPR